MGTKGREWSYFASHGLGIPDLLYGTPVNHTVKIRQLQALFTAHELNWRDGIGYCICGGGSPKSAWFSAQTQPAYTFRPFCLIYVLLLLLLLLLFYLFKPTSRWARGMTKIRSITKYYKIGWNDLPPHQQSSHEAELYWSVESTAANS